jgi:hypothetical protein
MNFTSIVIVDCNAFVSNQYPFYWFRTQVETIGNNVEATTSTIAHVMKVRMQVCKAMFWFL